MRRPLYPTLAIALVIGLVAGSLEGLAVAARNIYAPPLALVGLTAPILPTCLLACLVAAVLYAIARVRRIEPGTRSAQVAGQCVGLLILLRGSLWWFDLLVAARGAGGQGPWWILPLIPIVSIALLAGAATRAFVARIAPTSRRLRAVVVASVLLAIGSAIPVYVMSTREAATRVEGAIGRPRDAGQLNVVLITIDTLRADRLRSLGGTNELMPNLDTLAADGALFTNAISQSPWTLPSIASIMTAVSPGHHGAGRSWNAFNLLARTPIQSNRSTVAEVLGVAGYRTQAIVTNPYLAARYGVDRGFAGFENLTMESEITFALADTLAFRLARGLLPQLSVSDVGASVTQRAGEWLQRHGSEKFFLWLHYIDAHAPYGDPATAANKSFRAELLEPAAQTLALQSDGKGRLGTRFAAIGRLRAGEIRLTAQQRRELIALYDAGVRYDDEQVGRVVALLDQLGLRQNTLVVITSDHGEEFWEHGGVEHGHTLYDELVRIPLIIIGPGIQSRRIDDVARLIDLAPTIIELTGGDAAALQPQGRSLRALLEGKADEPRIALSEGMIFADEKRSLRTSELKYVQSSNGKEELYDLRADQAELRDLSSREDLVAGFRTALKATKLARPTHQPLSVEPGTAALQERLRALGYGK